MSNRSNSGQTKKRNRGLLSCLEGHRRKQKCNRKRPCSDCVERGLPEKCIYCDLPLGTLSTFDPFSMLPEMIGEPVPKQLLIRYYLERLAPWFCYLEDNLADIKPRIGWLPFALVHKPFFYATLLTAAVHLNRKRRFRDPAALLWFKAETIRAANEKMDDPAEAASDEMIMVALILLFFNVSSRFSWAKV